MNLEQAGRLLKLKQHPACVCVIGLAFRRLTAFLFASWKEVAMLKIVKIRSFEMGLYFRDDEFKALLGKGWHWFFHPLGRIRVDVVSQRAPWFAHEQLDMIVKSGALAERAV